MEHHQFHASLHEPIDLSKPLEELTPEERLRYDHQILHEKHKGHEAMHTEMVAILFVTMVMAQIVLVQWHRYHYRSYLLVSLVAMWLIPFCTSCFYGWWRFISVWLIVSTLTAFVVRKASTKPIEGTTPRLVYKWFLFLYKVSYGLGIIGYIIIMLTLVGANVVLQQSSNRWMDLGLLFIFYGLYIGILGRDISEICSDKMAATIGYYTGEGMPTRHLESNVCAVCGNKLLVAAQEEGILENTYKLSCHHVFHEFCIRGWCIVGKKQTCPYCKEKVDLKKIFPNPWERPHLLYGRLLDWLRYLLAWQPMILFLVHGINWILGLE